MEVLSEHCRTIHKVWQRYTSDPQIIVTNVTLNGRLSDQKLELSPKTTDPVNQRKQSEIILLHLYTCKIIFVKVL